MDAEQHGKGRKGKGRQPAEQEAGAPDSRRHGRVRCYDPSKGYGFLAVPGCRDAVFFLRSNLPKELRAQGGEDLRDLLVSFELYRNEEGKPRASRLRPAAALAGGPAHA